MNFEINHKMTPPPTKKINRLWIITTLVVLLCVAVIIANLTFHKLSEDVAPFPVSITSSLNYTVYYSAGNSGGYSYQSGSAKIQAGLLFYSMAKTGSKQKIFVTEQPSPTNSVNFSSLPNHNNLDVSIGKAVIGTGLGNPSIVIMTPSTLIQLTSNKGVTKYEISSVAQKMSRLAQAGNQY